MSLYAELGEGSRFSCCSVELVFGHVAIIYFRPQASMEPVFLGVGFVTKVWRLVIVVLLGSCRNGRLLAVRMCSCYIYTFGEFGTIP